MTDKKTAHMTKCPECDHMFDTDPHGHIDAIIWGRVDGQVKAIRDGLADHDRELLREFVEWTRKYNLPRLDLVDVECYLLARGEK